MKANKKVSTKPATSVKGYWRAYKSDGTAKDPSPAVRMLDKHNQIVLFPTGHHVGVSVTGVSMRDGVMKGKYKGIRVTHQSGGIWGIA